MSTFPSLSACAMLTGDESLVRQEGGRALRTEFFDVAVAGGPMRVARLGSGGPLILGIHGITGSCLQLAPLARRIDGSGTVIAPDLRGRGHSNGLPGPYGLPAHADDCAAVLAQVTGSPVVVVGESMGAYVAVVLAARYPGLVERLVLVDGGFTLPLPAGLDPEAVLEAVLGPALARLDQVFATKEAYFAFWRAHPALARDWGEDYEAYFDYDLEPVEGGFRSRARPEPVRVDGLQHIVDPTLIEEALRRVRCPVALLRAPRNLLDQPVPTLPDEAIDPWRSVLGHFSEAMVEDTNHYTLMFGRRGVERIAQLVAGSDLDAPGG